MAKVYLETSFFSACVSDRTDPASIFRKEESRRWWTDERSVHELSICAEVLRELSEPTYRNRDIALAMTADVAILRIGPEVLEFAKTLVREHVMPGPEASGDALHVAAATVHSVEYLLTWNVRHLANMNKVKHLTEICRRTGYSPPSIITPNLLWR